MRFQVKHWIQVWNGFWMLGNFHYTFFYPPWRSPFNYTVNNSGGLEDDKKGKRWEYTIKEKKWMYMASLIHIFVLYLYVWRSIINRPPSLLLIKIRVVSITTRRRREGTFSLMDQIPHYKWDNLQQNCRPKWILRHIL